MQRLHWTLIFIFWVQFVILKKINAVVDIIIVGIYIKMMIL